MATSPACHHNRGSNWLTEVRLQNGRRNGACVLRRAAYKWWSEALDSLIGIQNAVHNWQSVLKKSGDVSSDLLKKCGLWGCLLSGVISSNIAQYVLLTTATQ